MLNIARDQRETLKKVKEKINFFLLLLFYIEKFIFARKPI